MSVAWVGVGVAAAGAISSNVQANKARGEAASQSRSALEFDQAQYDDWQEIYGPVQDNLSEYYSSLTPEYYETIGLETFNQEQETAMLRLNENLAQRGIDPSSGIAASLESQSELDAAETRAGIRRDAPRQVAEDKSRFLQIGLGQNPASSLSNTLSQQARDAESRADLAEQAAGKATGTAIRTAGTALADYYNKPSVSTDTAYAGSPTIDYNTGVV